MAKYLRLFQTVADRQAAELDYPNVNYTIENGSIEILESAPVPPAFGGLTVKYNIEDPTVEVTLFKGGGGSSTSSSSSGSGSGSGGGGVMPTRMIVDGDEETPINTWRFETAGEHIVQYEFEDNVIPGSFLNNNVPTATEAIIGDDITEIGDTAFQGSTITSATISNSVTSIGNGAFQDCYGLTSVTIPDSVTRIGDGAFMSCAGLSSLTIGDSVNTIWRNAFSYCSGLTSVTIPSSVTTIGDGAFANYNRSLASVTVNATTPPVLGGGAIDNTANNFVIYVPAASVNTYKAASGWSDFSSSIQPIS